MVRARRTKRASAEDLYKTCKASGTCPPDVVNKIEGTTTADLLLKYGSSAVFLGGLGIGTGRGTGGGMGYRPLGGATGGVRVGAGTAVRPNAAVDVLGPQDVAPLLPGRPEVFEDPELFGPAAGPAVGATDPSVIELVDLGTSGDVSVVGEIPASGDSVPSVSGGAPTLDISGPPDTAAPPTFGAHGEPGLHTIPGSTARYGESSYTHHVLVRQAMGQTLGDVEAPEEIPLLDLSGGSVETGGFRTSTPAGNISRTRGFTGRRYQQVRVSDPQFLSGVRSLATFTNPAYDGDLTVTLPFSDIPTAAPDEAFTDVVTVHRPQFTRGPEGRVRVFRIGQRGSMRTRSGATVGAEVHFFRDVSSIAPQESIELQPIGEGTGDLGIPEGHPGDDFDIIDLAEPSTYSEEDLLDAVEELNLGPLRIGSSNEVVYVDKGPWSVYTDGLGGITVDYGKDPSPPGMSRPVDGGTKRPAPSDDTVYYSAGVLDPSLLRRRRKRRRSVAYGF